MRAFGAQSFPSSPWPPQAARAIRGRIARDRPVRRPARSLAWPARGGLIGHAPNPSRPRRRPSDPPMAPRKPKVVVTRKLPDAVETRMRELFDTELNLDDAPMNTEALAAAMTRCDVLAPTITDRIDAELIARAGEKLKLIANFGVGI